MRVYLTNECGYLTKSGETIVAWHRITGCKTCAIVAGDRTASPREEQTEKMGIGEPNYMSILRNRSSSMSWHIDLCNEHADVLLDFMTTTEE
tara:strand:- start:23550 stop:23825 length:276 start_codon:yes stop_codon:yes gene_type:complete